MVIEMNNAYGLETDCILGVGQESWEKEETDESKRIVRNLMETLESHRKKMKVDHADIEEFLSNIVDRMDTMDVTAQENPALQKYMYSAETVESIVDTLPQWL